MNALEIAGLTHRFGMVTTLADVRLSVPVGTFCVLVGPSGCGKTTLLRCIAGLETPVAGTISIQGQPVNTVEPSRRDVAMVFQNYALYPHLTVRDNLAFPLKMRGLSAAEQHQTIADAAALLQIQDLLERKPNQLSGGQRQRVAIGRAIVRQPKLFLFDEPLSNLDARLRGEMRVELGRLHRRLNATVLYVTHDQVEALTLGQMIVVLNRGRIEQIGTPTEVFDRPATKFVAQFLGSPPMNFVAGIICDGVFRAGAWTVPVSEWAGIDGAGELGFRPEAVTVTPVATEQGVAVVEWLENLGCDRYAYMRLKSEKPIPIVARVSTRVEMAVNQPVALTVSTSAAHWFVSDRRVAGGQVG